MMCTAGRELPPKRSVAARGHVRTVQRLLLRDPLGPGQGGPRDRTVLFRRPDLHSQVNLRIWRKHNNTQRRLRGVLRGTDEHHKKCDYIHDNVRLMSKKAMMVLFFVAVNLVNAILKDVDQGQSVAITGQVPLGDERRAYLLDENKKVLGLISIDRHRVVNVMRNASLKLRKYLLPTFVVVATCSILVQSELVRCHPDERARDWVRHRGRRHHHRDARAREIAEVIDDSFDEMVEQVRSSTTSTPVTARAGSFAACTHSFSPARFFTWCSSSSTF